MLAHTTLLKDFRKEHCCGTITKCCDTYVEDRLLPYQARIHARSRGRAGFRVKISACTDSNQLCYFLVRRTQYNHDTFSEENIELSFVILRRQRHTTAMQVEQQGSVLPGIIFPAFDSTHSRIPLEKESSIQNQGMGSHAGWKDKKKRGKSKGSASTASSLPTTILREF